MQYAYLPIRYVGVTQGINGTTSHQGLRAIDFGYSSTDKTSLNLYAPFDCKVVALFGSTNVLAIESLEPVKYADGTEDYMTIITCHDNNPPKLNTIFNQGDVYSHMGTKGGVATHCHMEVQKGKYQKYTGTKKTGAKATSLVFPNTLIHYDVLYVVDDVKYSSKAIYNPYTWKKVEKVEETKEEVKDDGYQAKYEEQLAKTNELQTKIDKIKEIVND